ncbi:unnamed protein product [Brassica napus]|uniref:(rape) hypothetical protein n=1 Tax=Brassica napus TaxID=3708 RepID=A0A816KK58_BRANA|nr:unnamed protein product [Brassica napus]
MFFSTDSFHRQPQTWKSLLTVDHDLPNHNSSSHKSLDHNLPDHNSPAKSVHNSSDQVFADHDH